MKVSNNHLGLLETDHERRSSIQIILMLQMSIYRTWKDRDSTGIHISFLEWNLFVRCFDCRRPLKALHRIYAEQGSS